MCSVLKHCQHNNDRDAHHVAVELFSSHNTLAVGGSTRHCIMHAETIDGQALRSIKQTLPPSCVRLCARCRRRNHVDSRCREEEVGALRPGKETSSTHNTGHTAHNAQHTRY